MKKAISRISKQLSRKMRALKHVTNQIQPKKIILSLEELKRATMMILTRKSCPKTHQNAPVHCSVVKRITYVHSLYSGYQKKS